MPNKKPTSTGPTPIPSSVSGPNRQSFGNVRAINRVSSNANANTLSTRRTRTGAGIHPSLTPSGTEAVPNVGSPTSNPIGPTLRQRQPTGRTPAVITESSSRRNRITLMSSRRLTSIATASNNNERERVGPISISLSNYIPLFSNISSRARDRSPSPAVRVSRAGKSKTKVSFSLPNMEQNPVEKVLESEKHLPNIFRYLNWNELLPIRCVSKKWLEVVTSDPYLEDKMGVITIRAPWEGKLEVYNSSPVIWTKFRILSKMFVDLMDSTQLEFWMKHGPSMKFLEIRNNSMTLSGLVEILSRCPNLNHFLVSWTPEMYSFNSELIKKYYGINFYNGNFASMKDLIIEKSSYVTDNALGSMLKWCGGPLRSLALTYPPEDQQDPLTRLKPRWTIEPLKNYFERFGYTGNLQYLNFSWSNLNTEDLRTLANAEQLTKLKGIILSHCKLTDDALAYLFAKKGQYLEQLQIDDVPITEAAFAKVANTLPNLKILDISGGKGKLNHLNFLPQLPSLEEFSAANTIWLDYITLIKPLKLKVSQKPLKKIDISGSIRITGTKYMDNNMNVVWFANLATALAKVVELNLSHWGQFGKNENFAMICRTMPLLEELRLRGWRDVTDAGVTGLPAEKLHQSRILVVSKEHKYRSYIGSLHNLRVLDLSGCNITDTSIKYGINFLPHLRKFAFEGTQISDIGVKIILEKNQTIDKISISGCEKIVTRKQKFERPDGRFVYVDKI